MKEYPKFISNQPSGNDKFEGASQERLSKAISEHFKNIDSKNDLCIPRIVGIEGTWGSGKSNVVKLLEQKLKENGYFFYEYDAWGNQEDLQRRSLLEQLTDKLVSNNVLTGTTTTKIKGGKPKTVTWSEKLKYLLARKTETVTDKYPRLGLGLVSSFLTLFSTIVLANISRILEINDWGKIIVTLSPIVLAALIWAVAAFFNKKYRSIGYFLMVYQDKVQNDICYETISECEPTVQEFTGWMKDLSNGINKSKYQKIVIVFDNMDRLPKEKVKQLWSSIHTFFANANNGFDNIWVIIPFDEKHLSCAFGDEDSKAQELTKYFINKTFPIVYRVAPPVITDYQNIFDKLFHEAFGTIIKEKDCSLINRLYRITKKDANVREIIVFINALVALHQTWEDEVNIVNMALFTLFKDELLKNPVNAILSGSYLKDVKKLISNKEQTEAEISALVFGIDVAYAKQIPLTQYLENCLENKDGYDINAYCESNPQFNLILRNVCEDIDDSKIDSTIENLNKLTIENEVTESIWNELAFRRMEQGLNDQSISSEFKVLIKRTKQEVQRNLINFLCKRITEYPEFKGDVYFDSLFELRKFLAENSINQSIPSFNKIVEPDVFMKYMVKAGNNFELFDIETDADKLDNYCSSLLPDKFTCGEIITILNKCEKYHFNNLLEEIKKLYEDNKVDSNNWSDTIKAYKALIGEKKVLPVMIDTSTINNIREEFESANKQNTEGYYDILAASISICDRDIQVEDAIMSYVAQNMDYYKDICESLVYVLSTSNSNLIKVLKYIVEKSLGKYMDLTKVISEFSNIRDKIGVSDERFLEFLNQWDSQNLFDSEGIQTIVKGDFYNASKSTKNALTDIINKKAIEELSKVDSDSLFTNNENYYWHKVIKSLIETDYMQPMPQNVVTYIGKLYESYAINNNTLSDYNKKIMLIVDLNSIGHVFIKLGNKYCNSTITISQDHFIFLEKGLREHGQIEKRADNTLTYIIKPMFKHTQTRSIIITNKDYYVGIINSAKERSDFDNYIKELIESTDDNSIIQFGNLIGINKSEKK